MKANNILFGLLIGVMAISLFTPVLAIYGFNQSTSMILLYMLPLVGATTAVALDSFPESTESKYEIKENSEVREGDKMNLLIGKNVCIEASSGKYIGIMGSCDEKVISLDNALREGNDNILDHVFIERSDIIKTEILTK